MSEFIKNEPTAREMAAMIIARSGKRIPAEWLVEVTELVVDGVHDGIEMGESIAGLPSSQPKPIESYHRGYMDAIEDLRKRDEEQ